MSYRDPKKNYDLFSALSKSRKQSERAIGIMKLKSIIDWEGDAKKGGLPPFDPVLMLKVLIIQKFPLN